MSYSYVNEIGGQVNYTKYLYGPYHGFLRTPAGTFTKIDVPGSSSTSALSINPPGAIVGAYYDRDDQLHGFLWTPTSPSTTTLTSNLNPSIYGQRVFWTAKVTTSGAFPPTGTVVFKSSSASGTFTLGTAILSASGIATLSRSNLNVGLGLYPLTAVYKGNPNTTPSTSPVLNQTVLQTKTAATITSSVSPSAVGQAVTFTAKITSPTVLPTGPVTFTMGTTVLGTEQLSGGKATFTTSSLPAGPNAIKVSYEGNSNIARSSAVLRQIVQ